jgi:hypothetical protein
LDAEKLCCGYNLCSLYRITQTYINRVFQRRLLIDLEVIEMIEPSEKFYNVLEEVFNKMNVKFEYDNKRYIHVSCVD